jgi:ADP-ribose pyrophosphatase YjhB (NUDIX family)
MNHRLRAAALVIRDRRLLLVKQIERRTGEHYWLPPGGAVESTDLSIFDCAKRETLEETGVQIEASRIVYIREFIDFAYEFRNFEVFVLADYARGEAAVREFWPETREYPRVTEVQWILQEQMSALTVHPEELKTEFWTDLQMGFPLTRHLGSKIRQHPPNPAVEAMPGGVSRK